MLQLKFTPSKQILISVIAVHLVVFSLFLDVNLALFTPILGISCVWNIRKWVGLTDKNSVQSVRIQQKKWRIKVNNRWLKVTLTNVRFFGWIFLGFKHKTGCFACLIASDSLDKNDFLDLIIAIKTHKPDDLP